MHCFGLFGFAQLLVWCLVFTTISTINVLDYVLKLERTSRKFLKDNQVVECLSIMMMVSLMNHLVATLYGITRKFQYHQSLKRGDLQV